MMTSKILQQVALMKRIKRQVQEYIYGNSLTVIVRIAIGLLFVYSSIFKIIDPSGFANSIAQYRILSDNLLPYAAIVIPYIELFAGTCLLMGFNIRPAVTAGIILMLVFITAIIINMAQGRTFECGCFELSSLGISETIGWGLLVRDAIITVLLWSLYYADRHPFSLQNLVLKSDMHNM